MHRPKAATYSMLWEKTCLIAYETCYDFEIMSKFDEHVVG